MTADNRVLALERAWILTIETGVPLSGPPADRAADVAAAAAVFYRFLEGPVILILSRDPVTYEQSAPDGPGTPTVMKGNTVQLTDIQQFTASVSEVDSKNQPVTGDNLSWVIDNPAVAALTPAPDGYSALIAGQSEGTATYTVSDNSATPPLTGSGTVTVVPSAATSFVISEGTAEDQPPAAPPSA